MRCNHLWEWSYCLIVWMSVILPNPPCPKIPVRERSTSLLACSTHKATVSSHTQVEALRYTLPRCCYDRGRWSFDSLMLLPPWSLQDSMKTRGKEKEIKEGRWKKSKRRKKRWWHVDTGSTNFDFLMKICRRSQLGAPRTSPHLTSPHLTCSSTLCLELSSLSFSYPCPLLDPTNECTMLPPLCTDSTCRSSVKRRRWW